MDLPLYARIAFLDPGSNASFCTDSLLQKLGGNGRPMNITLNTMGNTHTVKTCAVDNLQICILDLQNVIDLPRIYTKEEIPISTNHIPKSKDIEQWAHLKDVSLPEINAEIGLLIGNNVPDAYTPIQLRTGPRGSPHATESMLGWIVWNLIRKNSLQSQEKKSLFVNAIDVEVISENEELTKLNSLVQQSINFEFPERNIDDEKEDSFADKCFVEKTKSSIELKENHYYLNLPFKQDGIYLPNNFPQAKQRLNYLKKKMIKDSIFRDKYNDFMNQLLIKGYAEKVSGSNLPGTPGHVWYLPHHGVYHPRKPNKLRVVFDCSASYLGTSLNSILLQGPDMTNNLLSVLLRFRQEKVAVIGDVEAMYHQVRVHPEDCDFLRFLWWPGGDVSQEPEVYRMKVHLFGAASSASCANFALRQTAADNREMFSSCISKGIEKNFYVDDFLASQENDNQAVSLIHDTREMCKFGGFNLTKWASNSSSVLASIPVEDRSTEVKLLDLKQDILPSQRALGVYWDTETDTFWFQGE